MPGAPNRALRGFQRVHLAAGASQKVHFDLKDRDLSMVTEAGEPIIAEGDYTVSVGGGQPDTSAQTLTKTSTSMGQKPARIRPAAAQNKRGASIAEAPLLFICTALIRGLSLT